MAIFGAGSKWEEEELKDDFVAHEYFVVGWNYLHAKDLFDTVGLLKAGDIIYLKANRPGAKSIRVKAIGVVKTSFVHSFIENRLNFEKSSDWSSFFIPVKWIKTEEFKIQIPEAEGKLTNIRSATFYEEHLPYVQREILQKLFKQDFKNKNIMDYELGQFITGVISVGLQTLQVWRETRSVEAVQSKAKEFDRITGSKLVMDEGLLLQQIVPSPVLNTLKGRVDLCWTDFNDAIGNPNITPRQLDRYGEGLQECICRELRIIKNLNGSLPTQAMKDWWDLYKCAN
tara:strand:- start:442 stop:1296 length:855 start_codon:yes stop_codon:yes gene_type:complete